MAASDVILMMKEFYNFQGRGHTSVARDTSYMLESDEGTVLAVTIKLGKTEFVLAYCRKAIADKWGVYCHRPFRRASNPGLTRSWAQCYSGGMFVFREVRFHLTREEKWMTCGE